MTTIQLTQEQKDKLIEMCNKLFPEFKWHFWETDDEDSPYPDMIGYNNQLNVGTGKYDPAFECHWLEFCIYYILPKLDLKILWGESIYEDLLIHATHPIQYLYVEFKKLK